MKVRSICCLASVTLLAGTAAFAAAVPAPTKAFVPDANLERTKVPDQYKWNPAPLLADVQAFEKALAEAATARAKIAAYRGRLADPTALRECLDLYFAARLEANRMTLWAKMRFDEDQRNAASQANNDRALKAMNAFMADTAFIRQELLKIDDAALAAACAKDPKLAAYKPYLDEVRRRRARVLSPDAERALALAGDNLWAEIDINELPSDFERVFNGMLTDLPLPTITDEAGRKVKLTLSSYPKYRASTDRRVRREAVDKLFGTLRSYQHVFAAALAGQVNLDVTFARARGYDTALAAYLDKDNVSPAVYTNLVQTIRANLAPLHRYVALRQRVLGLKEVRMADLYAPIVGTVKMQVPFERAREIVPAALEPLGPDYLEVLREGLDPKNGWIDVYPNRDKDSGAYSSSIYGVHPFVKMNYLDDVENLSTLAHEYGHALHSHLSMTTQPYPTASYSMVLAEVASTFNEKLLSDYLYKNATTDAERLYILNRRVESIRTTIYRQTLFAEFELALHTAAEKGIPLTAELINKTYGDLVRAYYGSGFTMGKDDEVEWAYIPHFYYKYYVYAYATGLSSGLALAEKVGSGDAKAREAYLGMLKGGCSRPPLELLEAAGVDLTRPDAIAAAARIFDESIAEMEKLLAKKK